MPGKNVLLILLLTTGALLTGCTGIMVGGTAAGVAAATHDRRTAGTIVEDQVIESKAALALLRETSLNGTHLNVTSVNNIVLLSGETPTEAQKKRAFELVRNVEKVRRVENEVVIGPPASMMSRSNDTWITAKVKTQVLTVKDMQGFDLTRVKIVTENGRVFLMGLVTNAEADAVTEVARRVQGVQRVVRLFEYVN